MTTTNTPSSDNEIKSLIDINGIQASSSYTLRVEYTDDVRITGKLRLGDSFELRPSVIGKIIQNEVSARDIKNRVFFISFYQKTLWNEAKKIEQHPLETLKYYNITPEGLIDILLKNNSHAEKIVKITSEWIFKKIDWE